MQETLAIHLDYFGKHDSGMPLDTKVACYLGGTSSRA